MRKMIKTLSRKLNITVFIGFFCLSIIPTFAQVVKVTPKVAVTLDKSKNKTVIVGSNDETAEKSIAVDVKVNVSICVSQGKLKINGWERNEIRAFVGGGSAVGFKVQQVSKQNNQPVWVMVVGFDTAKKTAGGNECLTGADIEIDVPRNAVVNVKNSESETTIESVGKVRVENVGGGIFLNDIANGVDATTYEGDVTVAKSSGAITLSSTTGNIIAFDIAPSEIGDIFKARTNSGAITLQNIEHRQLEINSNSGSMKFTGEFQNGGQYKFGTQNGSISLAIPETSSCKILASYGYGAFNSELPLQNVLKSPASKTQSLTASMGAGEATLNLTTYSGAIRIRKK